MHVLIADRMPEETQDQLVALGLDVTVNADVGSHDLPGVIGETEILVVGRTRVTRRTIEAAPRLRLIIHAGSGIDTIDVGAASARGIQVAHCPAAGASAKAELFFGLVLALDRGLQAAFPQAGPPGAGLAGRTLGLVGYDETAQKIQRIAAGFGMRVVVYDPTLTTALASENEVQRADSMASLFRRAEVVSLHPDGDDVVATAELLATLPAGAILVNLSGRGLVDLAAAAARLEAGDLSLALDVYDSDDYGDDVPFAADAFPGRFIATDRLASLTDQARHATAHSVVTHIEGFLASGRSPGCVNMRHAERAPVRLTLRYRPGQGALAATLDALRGAQLAVGDVCTETFVDGQAAVAMIGLERAPQAPTFVAITRHPAVLDASCD